MHQTKLSSRVPDEIENTILQDTAHLALSTLYILEPSQIASSIATSRTKFHAAVWKVNKVSRLLKHSTAFANNDNIASIV
jgi:hypothetical protein